MLKSNKIRQLLAFGIVLAAVSLAITIAVKVYWGRRPGAATPRVPLAADIALRKIRYTETKKGRKQWDLLADKAEYDRVRELTRLTGVRLTVAGATSTGDIDLLADRADYYNKTGDVQLMGNVRAWSAAGMEFSSASAGYLAASSMIVTPDRVRFSDGMLTVEGVGMELMTVSRQVKIKQQVTANITPGNTRK